MDRGIVACATALLLAACSAQGSGGARDGATSSDDGGARRDASSGMDARVPSGDAGSSIIDAGVDARIDRTAFCMGMGPPVIVGDSTTGTETCAGSIATRVFDHALCTCSDANIVGYLRTRSFDSGMGLGEVEAGGPVGINRDYLTGGYADVGGSFVVAGGAGVRFGGYLEVRGDARFADDVNAAGYIHVQRDLWVLGNVTNIGLLSVDGDLHQPSGRSLTTFPRIGGSTIRTPFTVEPPCGCEPREIVDIAALVAHARTENDNADVGLDPDALAAVAGLGVDITLPCGRFYLTGIGGLGDITLHITGRTALFVDGDVNALGVFDIDLEAGGELDLFIRDDLVSIGAGSYGDRARPARTRVYVGGTGDVTLVGASGFVGNVYAPNARITAPGATTVYGSLFGRLVEMPGYLDVRYDRAILDVDRECPTPPECGMCEGAGCTDDRACVGGECVACTSDADCCAPLVCNPDGTCGPLLF
jgi:hypothetical protein